MLYVVWRCRPFAWRGGVWGTWYVRLVHVATIVATQSDCSVQVAPYGIHPNHRYALQIIIIYIVYYHGVEWNSNCNKGSNWSNRVSKPERQAEGSNSKLCERKRRFCRATDRLRKKFMLYLSTKSIRLPFMNPRLDCACSHSINRYNKRSGNLYYWFIVLCPRFLHRSLIE